jgi:hypothetical protein
MAKHITYQPYLFAIALLTLLSKVAHSLTKGQRVLDSLLWAFVAVFLVSSLLYYLEVKNASRTAPKSISANIKTGHVTDSKVTGVSGTAEDDARVKIVTKDVKKSEVKGYEGKP